MVCLVEDPVNLTNGGISSQPHLFRSKTDGVRNRLPNCSDRSALNEFENL